MKTRLTAVAFALSIAAAIFLLVWPVYSEFHAGRPTRATLVEINGEWVIVPVMFPVLVALVSLVVRKQVVRIIAAIVMGAFVFLGGMSIGLFYLPAGVLMLLAACVEDSAKFRDIW
jgi:hypothetical protein